jgi:hypothetical protein
MMNKKPYGSYMIFYFFGKGKSFSHKSGNPLTHRIIESFYMIGFSGMFSNRTVTFRGKDMGICLPKICVDHRALTICGRKRIPESLCTLPAPVADMHTDNFSCIPINCKPYPIFIIFASDKRVHFVTPDCQAFPIFGDRFCFFSTSLYFSLT